MSSQMQGMDTEYARQVSGEMGSHAGQVAGVCGKLFARVAATSWVGSDKDQFQDDMSTHFIPQANNAAESIDQQARVLGEHADRQDAASS
jgi:hypothetical protein